MNKIDVKLKDFQPCNEWEKRDDMYMDQSTGRIYTIFTDTTSRCLNLIGVFTPILSSGVNLLYRGVTLITLSHFWLDCDDETPYNLKDRLINAGIDLVRFLATPLICIALQVVAIYELFKPLDGAKLYASIERLGYSHVGRPGIQPINLMFFPKNIWNNSKDAETENRRLRRDLLSVWRLGNNSDVPRPRDPQNRLRLGEGGGIGGGPDHPQSPPGLPPSPANIPSLIDLLESENDQYWKKAIATQQKSTAEARERLKSYKKEQATKEDAQIAEIRATVAHLPENDPKRLASERFIKTLKETRKSMLVNLDEIAITWGIPGS